MTLNKLIRNHTNTLEHQEPIKPDTGLLTDLGTISRARITGFSPSLSSDSKTQLQAYGVLPGNTVRVRQTNPVIVIQIEHTELALEAELAKLIYVSNE